MVEADGSEPSSIALTREVASAFTSRDWQRLRGLYHEEAILTPVAAFEELLTPDEIIEVFSRLDQDPFYELGEMSTVALDDHASMVSGRLRFRLASGGFGDGFRAWVLTFKDDQLFRTRAYSSEDEARAAYAEHGIGLGI